MRSRGQAVSRLIVLIFSGSLKLSLGAGVLDMFLKISLYFLHERIWNYIPYGRPKRPEYEI